MQYQYFQNYTMAFKIEGKEMYPIFVFAMFCSLVHYQVVRLGALAHSKQRKTTPTQTPQFHVKFMRMPINVREGILLGGGKKLP